MEETISLKELLQTLRKRLGLITVITITAALISGIVSYFFLTPIYQASTQILVNESKNNQNLANSNATVTNETVMETYNVIIKSPAILDIVGEELETPMTTGQLNGKITVGSEGGSQVVKISVQDTDPIQAAEIANTTAEVFQKEVIKIMKIDNVSILAKATVPDYASPIKPNPELNVAIALVLGLMAGIGLAFLLDYFDNTIKSEQDIEKMLGMPVLGVISIIEAEDEKALKHRTSRNTKVRGESVGS